jgi:diguanylate cyclase (GGDEF)-like protein
LSMVLSAENINSREAGSLRGLIQRVVGKLAEGAADGQAGFDEARSALAPYVERYKEIIDANVQRVVESQQGRARLEEIKQRVTEEVNRRIAGKEVPRFLIQLLKLGWSSLLVTTLLHDGDPSPRWQEYLGVLDTLLDWFDTANAEIPVLPWEAERLLASLERGFAAAPVSPQQQQALLEDVRQALLGDQGRFRRLVLERIKVPPRPAGSGAEGEGPIRLGGELAKWDQAIRSLKIGDWVVERKPEGVARPLSLVWTGERGEPLVFVDGKGVRSLECRLLEMAKLLDGGRLSLLEDGGLPLVERAVQRVLKNTYEKVLYNSGHDPLTGLINRRDFVKEAERMLRLAQREGSHHVLLVIDIDQFKMINDLCGYEGGDRLLVDVSHILKTYVTDSAVLGRVGDDEFGVLLENCAHAHGFETAENLRKALENFTFNWEGRRLAVSCSIGMTELHPQAESAPRLLHDAEAACRLAKQSGGNVTKVFAATDAGIVSMRGALDAVTLVEEAIQKGRLQLYLQKISPVFFLDDPKEHYEVLLRVLDEKGRVMPPQDFIKAAEKFGRIRTLDRWVINHLFQWIESHQGRLEAVGGFSINLSGQSIDDEDMIALISEKVRQSSLAPDRIAFEITETAMIRDMAKAQHFIQKIQELGCGFYLDDFGSGLASYSYLKDLPVDFIKIDGAFVRNIVSDENDHAFVKSITEIAHFMKKKVVAEFVENESILIRLQELEVDYVQGYGIGRPFPLANLLS